MKITLLDDESLRFTGEPGAMTIEAPSVSQSYSPFHMLAGGLAYCTWSVLHSWATHATIGADDLAIEVRWTFADDPHRVASMAITLDWPSLSPQRVTAAQRVAELCTVHATLTHPPALAVDVKSVDVKSVDVKSVDVKSVDEAPSEQSQPQAIATGA